MTGEDRDAYAVVWILTITTPSYKATSLENPNIDGNNEETSLEETTEDYWAGSGSGPEDEQSLQNETREALTHEASDHDAVVYVGEGGAYVPVPSLKNRPLSPNLQALQTLQGLQGLTGGGGTGVVADEEWRRHPETWDREHRRYRPNTTRVQHIEAECQDDYMKIRIGFNGSFTGLLYSAGKVTCGIFYLTYYSLQRDTSRTRRYNSSNAINRNRSHRVDRLLGPIEMRLRNQNFLEGEIRIFAIVLLRQGQSHLITGYSYDPDCMYVNGTGRDYYEFYIQLNRCGTLGENTHHQDSRKNPTKNLMWNTVTVQYNPLIEEEFDEHFKVTCEYGYDFWKTVTFPFLDVEVATGNPVVFTLQPPECYMEIRYGYGTTGTRVAGPVRVGDPLTLIIYMRSKYDGFDIVVNDCYAHNGGNKRIQLIDQYGCPVDDKLISRFRGSWSESGLFETQVFAYMKTFRFTGSPALYIECDVRMCHGRCPSQPCHWRNAKNVAKRSVSDMIGGPTTPATSLSENVNLFQSLRVLQEGEVDTELFQNSTAASRNANKFAGPNDPSNDRVCLRSSVMSTIVGLGCGIICLLSGTLLAMCSRMRRQAREKLLSDSISYMTHKGRIN
uniref:ZP domain-containing protein n=1 Tax=Vespula pensylvanica TaxID=30213 RepID=A0A834UDT1_VESPE|nr:hypothetical protein H0235_005271 [Vespula pensylvanica]